MENGEATSGRSTTSAMSGILISRFFGFLREMTIASFFGLSPQVDAFYAAYRIPNFFRTLLGEGSLSAAFVPVLSHTLHLRGEAASRHLTQAFFSLLLIISGLLTLLGISFAPSIITAIAPGFSPEVHELATEIMRITFPFFLFLVLGAWAMGILHTRGRFFLPSVAPICLSGAQIASLLFFGAYFSPDPIYALAWGVFVGGVLQFLVQVPMLIREGYAIRLIWDPGLSELKRIGVLFVPVVIALGVNQVNSLVDTFLSSFLAEGSLATLGYATRLYTFPLGLFGASIAMVALPSLSRSTARGGEAESSHAVQVRGWWLRTLYFLIPSAVFLVLYPHEIVGLIYERGAFGSGEVHRVGEVLRLYAIGLPAFGTVKVLASGFHSLQDTRTPMNKAIVITVTNTILSIALMQTLGVRGIALATAVAANVHVFLLTRALSRAAGVKILDRFMGKTIAKMVVGCAVMAVVGEFLWRSALGDLGDNGFPFHLLSIILLVASMSGTYHLTAVLTGIRKRGGV